MWRLVAKSRYELCINGVTLHLRRRLTTTFELCRRNAASAASVARSIVQILEGLSCYVILEYVNV